MKKFVTLISIFLLTISTALADDMRFIQVTDTLFSKANTTSTQTLKNLVQNINATKDTEFVVFTGNNIARPNTADLEAFLEIVKDLKKQNFVLGRNCEYNTRIKYWIFVAVLSLRVKKF